MKALSHRYISSRGGRATMATYGQEHYKKMGALSHISRLKKYGADYYRELNKKSQLARQKKNTA